MRFGFLVCVNKLPSPELLSEACAQSAGTDISDDCLCRLLEYLFQSLRSPHQRGGIS
jgi:hypothetical protein